MIEGDHQSRNIGSEVDSVVVAEGFAKGMGTVISLEIDEFAPLFDEMVQIIHAERLVGPHFCYKKRSFILSLWPYLEIVADRLVGGLINRDTSNFCGLFLAQLKAIAQFKIFDGSQGNAQKIAWPKVRVDAGRK